LYHSDRSVHFASQECTGLLKEHQAQISMSRMENPYDNAACESFLKTLKYEEVYSNTYRNFNEARTSIQTFWSGSTIRNGFTRHLDIYLPPGLRVARPE
jgi:putative transposase